jgi:cobalt-zinc-cadmium efflux system outer membrane protein
MGRRIVRGFFTAALIVLCVAALGLLAPAPAAAQTAPAPPGQASPPMTFRQVLDLAMAQNLELAAVRRNRAVREAEIRAAGQWANPEFSAEITRDVPHGDLAIGFPVDIGGLRSKRVALAKAGLALADVDEANAAKQLRHDVRLAFYGLLVANETAVLAEDVVKVALRVRDVAQARFEEGAAPRLDVMQADLGVVRGQTDLDLARSSGRAARSDLNALLNRPAGMSLVLAGGAADLPPLPTIDAATASALGHNVDLMAMDKEAESEAVNLRLLRAERVPQPTFTFGTALNAPGEFNVGPHAGLSLAIPLFSRNQGEIAGSLARTGTIKSRREALRRQVEARVFAAVERLTARRAQVEAFRTRLLPTATELEGMAEESYRLGRNSILAALDAQRSLRDVKFEYLQALLALQEAAADLEDILGAPIQ